MKYILSVLIIVATLSCTQDKREFELENLYKKEKSIWCKLDSLHNSINTHWNNVNELLATSMSEDTPPEERKNILSVRNADLLRMFESYRALDTAVQNKITKTENMDKEIANEVTVLKKELSSISKSKSELIHQLAQKKPKEKIIESLNQKYSSERPCITKY